MNQKSKRDLYLGLVAGGIGLWLSGLWFAGSPLLSLLGLCLSIIGLALYARSRERTALWGSLGLLPVVGPVLALAALTLDDSLTQRSASITARRLFVVIAFIIATALFLALVIPNFIRFSMTTPRPETRPDRGGLPASRPAASANLDDDPPSSSGTSTRTRRA